jgi:uncharacterized RmlC-like cupin family protein
MRRVRIAGCFVGLVACFVTVACGGGSSSTVGSVAAGGSEAGGARKAIHEPVQSRGTKGEDPRAEAATAARISLSDCMMLASLAEERLGTKLRLHSDASPPLSHCLIDGHGTEVNVYLDSGFAAHQRYANRIEETVQFNGENPAGLPQAVPHVGEKAAYNADASWIPALGSLLAVRGNRWLTVTISVPGRSGDELRDEAAVLARAGFKLTAVG